MQKVKHLILDVGDVLIDYDAHRIGNQLTEYSEYHKFRNNQKLVNEKLYDLNVRFFEKGNSNSRDFFYTVRELLDLDITKDKFWEIWNDIDWQVNDDLCAILEELISKNKILPENIHILSNMNIGHWDCFLNNIFPPRISNIVKGLRMASCELGCRKPEIDIYIKTLGKIQRSRDSRADYLACSHPENYLLVDDLPENVEAFRKLGGNAILYPSEMDKLYDYF